MFLFIAIGFAMRRLKLLPDNAAAVLSRLESDLIIPGMVLNSFIHHCTMESIVRTYPTMLLSLGLELIVILLAWPLSKLFEKEGYYRNLYRYQLIYVSWGFMGYALIQALFGAETLYYFILFSLPMSVGITGTPTKVWAASPDYNWSSPQELAFTQNGSRIDFTLPALKYWTMIVVEY